MRIYIGTYARAGGKGIYQLNLHPETGALAQPQLAVDVVDPPFLAIHPGGRLLYSSGQMADADGNVIGAVNAYSLDPTTGRLTLLNQQPSCGPRTPCHVSVDRTGRFALATNYPNGAVAVFPIEADGRLGLMTGFAQHHGASMNPARQEGPHTHSINMDPTNQWALVCDLGLDKVFVYRLDTNCGALIPNDPPAIELAPGSGPRHLAFHPNGKFVFVLNEIFSTVTALAWNSEKGTATEIQTASLLPPGMKLADSIAADVQVHPSGEFLYASNRGHDSLAMFAVDPATGKLSYLGDQPSAGKTPRNFGIDPTGRWLVEAHQDSDTVCVFRIDTSSGKLHLTDYKVQIPSPVCVKFYSGGSS